MKLLPLAIAALICGSALAQAPDAAKRADNRSKADAVANKNTPDARQRANNRAKAGNVADKSRDVAKRTGSAAKRGVQRAGDVTRNAAAKVTSTGEAIARKLPPAPAERGMDAERDRAAMGAAPAGSVPAGAQGDSNRRQRMDSAYDGWRRQSGSR